MPGIFTAQSGALAASRTPGRRTDPPPFVLRTALPDFYLEYELNGHLDTPEQ